MIKRDFLINFVFASLIKGTSRHQSVLALAWSCLLLSWSCVYERCLPLWIHVLQEIHLWTIIDRVGKWVLSLACTTQITARIPLKAAVSSKTKFPGLLTQELCRNYTTYSFIELLLVLVTYTPCCHSEQQSAM